MLTTVPPGWTGTAEGLVAEVAALVRDSGLDVEAPSLRTVRLWRTKRILSDAGERRFGRRQVLEALAAAVLVARGWSAKAIAERFTDASDVELEAIAAGAREGAAGNASGGGLAPVDLDGDRPKRHLRDDRLGYAGFSWAVARAIHRMPSGEGIALAINGPWGSGKTSALNMVLEALRELERGGDGARRTEIVHFNPWWFSGQEDLVRAFFDEVAATLEDASVSKRIIDGFKAVGRRASGNKDLVLAGLELLPGGTAVKGLAGGALDIAAKAYGGRKSLVAERADLCEALREQGKRLVVVIDDVDRLPQDEAVQVFRMVKSVADLPNVVHLLAFDRDLARAATAFGGDGDGPDWLDKILQATFDLPPVRRGDLLEMFLDELERLAQPRPFVDQARWGNALHGAVAPWLASPRDVRRLINTLAVSWRAVAGEVDFADFVALEALRLFEPDLHREVRRNEGRLVGTGERGQGSEEAFADDLLTRAKPARRDAAKEALWRLFPRLERAWRNQGYSPQHFARWDRERRACVERHFPAYFGYDVGGGALKRSEVDAALADLCDASAFRARVAACARVRRKAGGSKAAVLLDEIRANVADIAPDRVGAAVVSVAAAADIFCDAPEAGGGFLSIPPIWRVWHVVEELLRRLPAGRRGRVLEDAVAASPSLLVHSFAVRAVAQEHGRDPERGGEATADPLVDGATLDRLEASLLDRLRSAARNGTLLRQARPVTLLLHWSELSSEEEVRAWTASATGSDDGAVALARAAVQTVRSVTGDDRVAHERPRVDRSVLAKIVDVDLLRARLARTAAPQSPGTQELLDRFETGLHERDA